MILRYQQLYRSFFQIYRFHIRLSLDLEVKADVTHIISARCLETGAGGVNRLEYYQECDSDNRGQRTTLAHLSADHDCNR
jgi:hypothetical protein